VTQYSLRSTRGQWACLYTPSMRNGWKVTEFDEDCSLTVRCSYFRSQSNQTIMKCDKRTQHSESLVRMTVQKKQ